MLPLINTGIFLELHWHEVKLMPELNSSAVYLSWQRWITVFTWLS